MLVTAPAGRNWAAGPADRRALEPRAEIPRAGRTRAATRNSEEEAGAGRQMPPAARRAWRIQRKTYRKESWAHRNADKSCSPFS
jgi:hypothetical protein